MLFFSVGILKIGNDVAEFARFSEGHWAFVVKFFKVLAEPLLPRRRKNFRFCCRARSSAATARAAKSPKTSACLIFKEFICSRTQTLVISRLVSSIRALIELRIISACPSSLASLDVLRAEAQLTSINSGISFGSLAHGKSWRPKQTSCALAPTKGARVPP